MADKMAIDGAQMEKLRVGWISEDAEKAWGLAMAPSLEE